MPDERRYDGDADMLFRCLLLTLPYADYFYAPIDADLLFAAFDAARHTIAAVI